MSLSTGCNYEWYIQCPNQKRLIDRCIRPRGPSILRMRDAKIYKVCIASMEISEDTDGRRQRASAQHPCDTISVDVAKAHHVTEPMVLHTLRRALNKGKVKLMHLAQQKNESFNTADVPIRNHKGVVVSFPTSLLLSLCLLFSRHGRSVVFAYNRSGGRYVNIDAPLRRCHRK